MPGETRRSALKSIGASIAGSLAFRGIPSADAAASKRAKARIKVGQIGVGHAHASKLEVFRKSDDYEVVGIVEPDEALRERARTQAAFRDVPWMSQEQLLATDGLQAVLVETRVQDLLDTAEACIQAGKHIHLDKPAGVSLPQFARILAEAEKKKLLVQMGYMYRYNPGVVLLRDMLSRGWLGDVFEVHAVMSKVVDPVNRKRFAQFRGGMMFELGCHVLDLVIGVLGKPDKVTPYARHASRLDDALEDNMLAVFEYPRALATVKTSALEVDGFARRHLVVCGTEGTLQVQPLDDPAVRLTLTSAHGEFEKGTRDVALPVYRRYVDDAADMARIIRGEKATDFSYEHDLTVQTALLQASGMPLTA